MRKNGIFHGLVLGALAFGLCGLVGCANPLGSDSSGSNNGSNNNGGGSGATQTLWNDGVYGTWLGFQESPQLGDITAKTVAVADTITGAPKTLLLTTDPITNAPGRIYLIFTPNEAPSASAYLTGHIQFDIMLASALNTNMIVAYSSATEGTCFTTTINLATLNTATFTQESLPLSGFAQSAGCSNTNGIQEPFYLSFPGVAANTKMVYVSDIQWTSN